MLRRPDPIRHRAQDDQDGDEVPLPRGSKVPFKTSTGETALNDPIDQLQDRAKGVNFKILKDLIAQGNERFTQQARAVVDRHANRDPGPLR